MQNGFALLRWRVVRELPHDASHFTQGLEIHGASLIESVGRYAQSALLLKDLVSGRVLDSRALPAQEFGEGATRFGDRVYQLTWREHVVHVYDAQLREQKALRFASEGWGLTHDGRELIASDGSDRLRFVDPQTFATTRSIQVTLNGTPLTQINELEFARGRIWANVWQSDYIVAIDPRDGTVRAVANLAALKDRFPKPPQWDPADHVLNGIAFDAGSGHFFVTGKCWPRLFEIEVEP